MHNVYVFNSKDNLSARLLNPPNSQKNDQRHDVSVLNGPVATDLSAKSSHVSKIKVVIMQNALIQTVAVFIRYIISLLLMML